MASSKAAAVLTPVVTNQSGVGGIIYFEQPAACPPGSHVQIKGQISGLTPGSHAFSINTNWKISEGDSATGAIFVELEPIVADQTGKANIDQKSDKITLVPGKPNGIVGKLLVVHDTEQSTSDRIAWGVIVSS